MKYKSLNNDQLNQHAKSVVGKENLATAVVVDVIHEIDSRRMYLAMGYANLFQYCLQEFGYAEGPAQRRIDAARMLKHVPDLCTHLADKTINLSQTARWRLRSVESSSPLCQSQSVSPSAAVRDEVRLICQNTAFCS